MNIFSKHPASIGESYLKHLGTALVFGLKMVGGGLACILHAFFPFIFEKTASEVVTKLNAEFLERSQNQAKNNH